ncbi:ChrR family anti-sigma-E factor [Corallincola spongiicola]|uniref:Transcriptional regulator n=1 Tax=Corallincola spongiicola TaxID=2520508 RepID=A0ABY1WQ55_9GAMM|nr:ChrR family anti-sigma-E factor [Corallincola spongiicola]TAA46839.1 hypothetical protein EXY25_06175 [Corallincola spongiicola]
MKPINHHPTSQLLQQFADGDLSPALSLAVSAHVDMCPHCQRALDVAEAELAQQWQFKEVSDETVAEQDLTTMPEFAAMFDQITRAEPAAIESNWESAPTPLLLGDKEFYLPRALQRFSAQAGRWRQMGKLSRSSLALEENVSASFIHIDADGQIPEHTHKGVEWTLVLDGSFSDEEGHYQAGDFIRCDGQHKHTPRTAMGEDCLCFAVVEAPLHFTSGLSRLLNPFARFMQ